MGKRVTIVSGFSTVVLPTRAGLASFSSGNTVDLTDAEYAALPASVTRALSTATNVAEPNRGTTDTQAVVAKVNTAATGTVTATPGYNAFKATGALTVALAGFAAGEVSKITVEITQDATGSRAITQPVGVKWVGGAAPTATTTANKIDVFEYWSRDGGTTVFGRIVGQAL